MNLLLVLSLLGQLEIKDGDKQIRLSLSEGLTLKTATKQVTLSGAGLKATTADGGHAFNGIGQTQSHHCVDGEDIDVAGTNNDVTLTGVCGEVTVSGLSNVVGIESAESIDVSGKNNHVNWSKGEPAVKKSGSGNTAIKAR